MRHSVNVAYEWQLGWRYVRAGRGGKNGFISFISGASVAGIALGVAALIVVLSVLNGFSTEVRDRMLSVIAHVELFPADGGPWPDAAAAAAQVRHDPMVLAVAPFVAGQGLLGRGDELRAVRVRGIDVALEAGVSDIARQLRDTALAALKPGQGQVVLGIELARQLAVAPGQAVTLCCRTPPGPAARRACCR